MANEPVDSDLPASLRAYFWDYEANRLSWGRNRHTIVHRLLQNGGLDAVNWLRAHLGDAELREFLVRRHGRGISARRLRFWGLILDIPRAEVDACIAAEASNPWHRRTHH